MEIVFLHQMLRKGGRQGRSLTKLSSTGLVGNLQGKKERNWSGWWQCHDSRGWFTESSDSWSNLLFPSHIKIPALRLILALSASLCKWLAPSLPSIPCYPFGSLGLPGTSYGLIPSSYPLQTRELFDLNHSSSSTVENFYKLYFPHPRTAQGNPLCSENKIIEFTSVFIFIV